MALHIQSSFAKGEVTPGLYGRVDTTMYDSALRTARNVVIRAAGGAGSRPGLLWIGLCKSHTHDPRLIKFEFSTLDTYILEFGDFYMRVIRNDGHVLEAPKTITNISNASPAVVTSAAHGFSNGDEVSIALVVGMLRGTLNGVNSRRFIVGGATTNTFTLTDQVIGGAIDTSTWTAYTSGGTASRVYTINSPYAIADTLTMEVTQSADVMTITHPSYPPQKLSRTGDTAWTFVAPTFAPSIQPPASLSGTAVASGSVNTMYAVTASAVGNLEESLPIYCTVTATQPYTGGSAAKDDTLAWEAVANAQIYSVYENINGLFVRIGQTQATTFENQNFAGDFSIGPPSASNPFAPGQITDVQMLTLGTYSSTPGYTINTSTGSGAVLVILMDPAGTAIELVQVMSGGTNYAPADTITFTGGSGSPQGTANLQLGPATGTYPATAGYYKQRLVYGGTNYAPDTSFYSQVSSEDNMSAASPPGDSDAITVSMASQQVNRIAHYLTCNTDLIIFTSGSEWQVNQGSGTDFSDQTITQNPQSSWGCSYLPPIQINRTLLYVPPNLATLRSFAFTIYQNGYIGTDLAVLSSHLFQTYIAVDMTYAKYPDPVVHICRSDGDLLALTFNEEQQMTAWTHWDTQGAFTRTASLPPAAPEVDEAVYFVVRRTINGQTVRYIERTHSERYTDVRDAFYVDAGVSFDNPIAITNVGLTNPCTVTAPAHGLTTGALIDVFDIEWQGTLDAMGNENQPGDIDTQNKIIVPQQLNTCRFIATVIDSNTITLADVHGNPVDATGYVPYVFGGTVRLTTKVVEGLDHLEGCTVAVLADGNVVRNLVVTNGAIMLPRPFSRVHVGLGFVADVETLNVEVPGGGGTIQGVMTKISYVTVRVQDSRGLWIGPDQFSLTEAKWRQFENMGDPTALFTGDRKIEMSPSWNTNGRVFIRQPNPLPMTILAIIPDIQVGS